MSHAEQPLALIWRLQQGKTIPEALSIPTVERETLNRDYTIDYQFGKRPFENRFNTLVAQLKELERHKSIADITDLPQTYIAELAHDAARNPFRLAEIVTNTVAPFIVGRPITNEEHASIKYYVAAQVFHLEQFAGSIAKEAVTVLDAIANHASEHANPKNDPSIKAGEIILRAVAQKYYHEWI